MKSNRIKLSTMTTKPKTKITVRADIAAPINQVWTAYTSPKYIVKWNFASSDWQSPSAKNELEPGGSFSYRMEAKDGSMGFDFEGVFQKVQPNELLSYVMGDGREAVVTFGDLGNLTRVTVTFEAEQMNPEELQQQGWQAILDNFKKCVEDFQHDSMHFEIEIEAPVSKVFELMLADESYRVRNVAWLLTFVSFAVQGILVFSIELLLIYWMIGEWQQGAFEKPGTAGQACGWCRPRPLRHAQARQAG